MLILTLICAWIVVVLCGIVGLIALIGFAACLIDQVSPDNGAVAITILVLCALAFFPALHTVRTLKMNVGVSSCTGEMGGAR